MQIDKPKQVGVFGGSFDPVHLGHLWIAETARETLELDQVRWIPTAQQPLKPDGAVASAADRYQMVQLAIAGAKGHRADDCEIRRGEVSYTVETLQELRERIPEARLFLIIGSDSLVSIRRWHQPERVLSLATLAVVQRGGEPEIDFSALNDFCSSSQLEAIRNSVVRMPLIELSSSELRARIAAGRSVRFRIPRAVEALIADRQLYTPKKSK